MFLICKFHIFFLNIELLCIINKELLSVGLVGEARVYEVVLGVGQFELA